MLIIWDIYSRNTCHYFIVSIEERKSKVIKITRAHLEEDAGKSIHGEFGNNTAIDLNRAGNPLLEIVSEPDMNNAKEAISYLKKIHSLVQYLEICDGNMQEGSFRCDANVSVSTIEHLMAAVWGCGIDNLIIEDAKSIKMTFCIISKISLFR